MKRIISVAVLSAMVLGSAIARKHIDVVGSSTVFPFATVVAETFGNRTGSPTPKIEATGSGGGIKLFCSGNGINTPDIASASRRIKTNELAQCYQNGVTDVTEVLVGFDGITIANARQGPKFDLTLKALYLALAAKVPQATAGKAEQQMVANPFTHWNQIDANLPAVKIKILGPPPTSGTRDALQELAIESGCQTYDFIKELKKKNKSQYKKLCRTVREDGAYVELGENDNLIVAKLVNDKHALGVFGFSFLEQNSDKVKGAAINAQAITFDNIASGDYPISRPLYLYIKNSHRGRIKGMNAFIAEFVDEDTFGEEGYLVDKGLIPTPQGRRKQLAKDAIEGKILKL